MTAMTAEERATEAIAAWYSCVATYPSGIPEAGRLVLAVTVAIAAHANAALEEAAKVAEQETWSATGRSIAAAIRALREEA